MKAELSASAARVLVLRAELIDPPTALSFGVLDELVSPDEALPRALEVASEMAALPRSAYPIVKKQLRRETLEVLAAVADGRADPVAAGWVSSETAAASAGILNS